MSAPTWHGEGGLTPPRVAGLGWLRVLRRGGAVVVLLLGGVALLLVLRLPERTFCGSRRPLTGPLVQGVCRACLWAMGIGWRVVGRPMRRPGPLVANHSGWLDIFAMGAALPVFFVSKDDVRSWPGINILTAVTDTHFVARDPARAREQTAALAARTRAGDRLLFFPEGTSSDSRRVLPFKPTLFQAFLDPAMQADLAIQPLTAVYEAPRGADPRFYGWWSDMALGPHLLAVLAQKPQGRVTVILHDPIPVAGETRKTLAAKAEAAVRDGMEVRGAVG